MKKYILTLLILIILIPVVSSAKTYIKSSSNVYLNVGNPLITNGLVAWYTFDGKSMVNGVAKNQSGTSNDARLINIATSTFYTEGKIGQGFNFDGSNDYLRVTTPIIGYGPGVPYTFAFWMYKNADVANQSNMFGGNGGTTNAWITAFLHNVTGTMFFRMCKENVDCRDTPVSGVLPTKTWIHVAGVYDSASTIMTLYINGASTTSRIANLTGVSTGSTQPEFIGSYKTPSLHFSGRMDDVRIYDRALSASEVMDIYRSGKVVLKSSI